MKISWEKYSFSRKYGRVIRLYSAKKMALKEIGCRKKWPKILVNNFRQKSTALTLCTVKTIWEKYAFSWQYGIVLKLVSKKKTALTAARCRENWTNWLVNNFRQKSTALTAAVCRKNYQRKVWFFTAVRYSYQTLVSNKNHCTYGSKLLWEFAVLTIE